MKARTKLIGIGAAALAIAVGTHAYNAYSEEAGGYGPPFMHHRMGRIMGPA